MFNKILDKAKRIDRDPKVLLEAELGKKLTGEETTTQLLEFFKNRPKKASGGIARVGMSKGNLAKWLLSFGKKKKPKIKKDRLATADEVEDAREIVDPTGEAYMVEEGMTVKELDKMVAEQKAYERHMYDQYKTGKLDPVAGEKTKARREFLQQKLDEAESSGDNRLITRDERDELESFTLSIEDIKISPEDQLRKEFPGIDDRMIKNILTDKNPQRIAEVKQTMREYLKLLEVGKSEQEAYDIITKAIRKPTKHAEGGRVAVDVWR